MRHLLYAIVFALCTTTLMAQELTVKSFQTVTTDLSARTHPRQDNNGNDCALVKVQIASAGVTFAGYVMGDVAFKNNEYWVYMTAGSKRLKVVHPNYLPLEVTFADYNINHLEGKTTYILRILSEMGNNNERDQIGQIIIDSDPQGAMVYIDDKLVGTTPLDDYRKPYGEYDYKVELEGYRTVFGTIDLSSNRAVEVLNLEPAFGFIEVSSEYSGARISLDGEDTGYLTPSLLPMIPPGLHTITLSYSDFEPYKEEIFVEDGDTIKVEGYFQSIARIVNIDASRERITFLNGDVLSYEQARELCENGAENGNVVAQYNLGLITFYGAGVKQDVKGAIRWIRKSAEQGYPTAQKEMGYFYLQGNGVYQSDSEAASWFLEAAQQGDVDSQNQIALMLLEGTGIKKDYEQAAYWFQQAAERGMAEAQYNLGLLYKKGRGVSKDKTLAEEWLKKAANQGYEEAKKALEDLENDDDDYEFGLGFLNWAFIILVLLIVLINKVNKDYSF